MTASLTRTASCHEILPQLSSYALGRLSLAETQQVYSHLLDCGTCWESADCQLAGTFARKPKSFLLIFPAAAAAAVFLAVPLFSSAHVSTPATFPAANPAPVSSTSASIQTGKAHFQPQAGSAYYIRLHVANLPAAEKTIGRILSAIPLTEIKGPYASRYYLTATPNQLAFFAHRLAEVGDPGVTRVGERRWRDEASFDQNACSATLDLVS